MEPVSYYDYSEYSQEIQDKLAGVTRKPGPETILSYDYDAYNYPPGTSHFEQIALSGFVLKKWLETIPAEAQADFYKRHDEANLAIEAQIERDLETRKRKRYQTMAWSGAALLGAGALAPALFAGGAGMGVTQSGLPYITEAGLAPSLQAATAAGTAGGLAAGLSATELAQLATAGYGVYKGITDQEIQEEALKMQEEYLAAQIEASKTRADIDAGLVFVPQPQAGPAQQPQTQIYQAPAAKLVSDYVPLVIVAIAAFLLFKKGKIK